MGPMLETMNLQPLFAGTGAHEAFEIAARMQALTAPVCSRKEGNRHLVPSRRTSLVIVVIKRMAENFVAEHPETRGRTAWPAFAKTVLDGFHLHVVPVRPESREDAAVMGHVAIPVGRTFPNAHRSQMWRLQ